MRLALIDHSFHRKTQSTHFFLDCYYCERWNGGPAVNLHAVRFADYDLVIFFQQLYSRSEMQCLGDPQRVVLVPMYDAVVGWPTRKWKDYRGYHFISFSTAVHNALLLAGCESLNVRYFSDLPASCVPPAPSLNREVTVMFWQRLPEISWRVVRTLLSRLPIKRVVYKRCPDPGASCEPIPKEDIRRFNVQEIPWLSSQLEYLRLVAECDIFIAPRRYEGIGMSFLEAMALGKIVVAPDHPTMNEYITHGHNGVLYDLNNPRPCIAASDIDRLAMNVSPSVKRYATEWLRSRVAIKEMICQVAATKSGVAGLLQRFKWGRRRSA
jgi:hypothetical protein